MNSKLTLGFSTCPNDTFIFDAMVYGKIDTEGLGFDVVMADVEELNHRAFKNELDITKLSFHAYAYMVDDYVLLNAGSALGNNCGPLIISKTQHLPAEVKELKIVIPGKYTTANFLLSLAYPDIKNKVEMLFSEIEDAVINGEADAGVIIHENRFTYHDKGLKKIIDLGEYWEGLTKLPIPLGGIALKRCLPAGLQEKINRVLRKSIEFAMANPNSSANFVKSNAQELDDEVIKKHIDLYVNNYTVDLGKKGRRAVNTFFERGAVAWIIPTVNRSIFLQKPLPIND